MCKEVDTAKLPIYLRLGGDLSFSRQYNICDTLVAGFRNGWFSCTVAEFFEQWLAHAIAPHRLRLRKPVHDSTYGVQGWCWPRLAGKVLI